MKNQKYFLNLILFFVFIVSIFQFSPVTAVGGSVTINSLSESNSSPIAGETITLGGIMSLSIVFDQANCGTPSGTATFTVSVNGGSSSTHSTSTPLVSSSTFSVNVGPYSISDSVSYSLSVSVTNGCVSDSASAGPKSFTVTSTAPTITSVTRDVQFPTPSSAPGISATITDPAGLSKYGLYYYPSGSSAIGQVFTYTGTSYSGVIGYIPQYSDGTTVNYYVEAWDTTGNLIAYSPTSAYTVDGTAPSITFIAVNSTAPTSSQSVKVSATITDSNSGISQATLYYSTDSGTTWSNTAMSASSTTYSATVPAQVYGTTVKFYIIARDNAGNSQTSTTNSYTVSSDVTAPVITSFSRNITNPTYSDSVKVSATITDSESGMKNATLFYTTDGGSNWLKIVMSNSGSTYSATIDPQTYNTIVSYYISAFDNANNNILSSTASYTTIDTTIPGIMNVYYSPSPAPAHQNIVVSATISDTGSGIQNSTIYYSTDNGNSWSTVAMSLQTNSIYQGSVPGQNYGVTVQYYIKVFDIANNFNQTPTSSYSTHDITAPNIVINSISPNNPQNYDSVTVNASITDQDSGVNSVTLFYSLTGGTSWITLTMTNSAGPYYNASIPAQSYFTTVYYKIQAIDTVGNAVNSTQYSYEVLDTYIPSISPISIYPNQPTINENVIVSANITDIGSGLQNETLYYSINNGVTWAFVNMVNVGGLTFNATIPGQSYGIVMIYYIVAFDNGNNKAQSPQNQFSIGDITPPEITSSPANFTYELGSTGNSLSWTATDLGAYNYTVSVDSSVFTSGDWTSGTPITFSVDNLAVGSYTFTIIISDLAGNTASSNVTVTVQDTTAPIFSSVPTNTSYTVGTTGHNLTWVAFDLSNGTYELYLNVLSIHSGTSY